MTSREGQIIHSASVIKPVRIERVAHLKRFFCGLLTGLLLFGSLAVRGQDFAPIQDTPFNQEVHEPHPLGSPAENDVRALALDKAGRVWAATGAGVRYLENGAWKTPADADIGPTHALYYDTQGQLWVGAWNGLYRATPEQVTRAGLEGMPVSAISGRKAGGTGSETLFAATPQGIWRKSSDVWAKIKGAWMTTIRAILPTPDDRLWIATASGLYRQDLTGDNPESKRYSKPPLLLSSNLYALKALPDGNLWIGSTGGLDLYSGAKRLRSLSVREGLPNRHARAIAVDSENRLWVATKLGVARYDGKRWSLRHSRRWLLSNDARDVALGADGTAWIATGVGVSAIRRKTMTLAQKADYFLQLLRARHLRPPGLVGPAVLLKQGDLSRSFIEDDDNDGEHTGEYLAMESFRYAVTKAPDARANAKVAFHALETLQQATGTGHFFARSVLPIGTAPLHEVDRTFTPQEIAETRRTDPREKLIEKRWLPSPDGKWLWKRDTSSDEVDGYLFGYSTYFTLAADADEKKSVAAQVDRIVGGIVKNGYVLQDIDGKATRWGNWSPESLNGDPNWYEERGGNSVEILAFLGIAQHITGNAKYREAANYLMQKHGYDRNMLLTSFDTPSERTHIEDELLGIVYPGLMTYLIDPKLKANSETSLRRWYKTCQRDGIPLYDFVYNKFSGQRASLAGSAFTLRDWPLDMIEWTVDNREREDIERETTPGTDEGFLKRMLPRSEMGLCMWDQEPYRALIGLDGMREDKPTDWLLAYWMGRYYGLITAPK